METTIYKSKLGLSAIVFVLSTTALHAQSSSHSSGFYAQDSLFFTLNYTPPSGGVVEVAVNCFTKDSCFAPYTGGIWLYNRNLLPNTWENQQLSKGATNFVIDTSAPRGHLQKTNVVLMRIKNSSGSITKEHAYFIGLNGSNASLNHSLPVVHLLVDSLDTFGPLGFYGPGQGLSTPNGQLWNYELDQSPLFENVVPRDRVEKNAIVEILDTNSHSLLYQHCGIRLSGNTSRTLTNKGMGVVARDTYFQGKKRFEVEFNDDEEEKYKWLRFRSGSSTQLDGFGTHEIFEQIINGLKIGEVNVYPVITYLNGSYWSLAFAQDKVQEYTVERLFGIDHDDVDLIRPLHALSYNDLLPLIQQNQIDTSLIVWATNPNTNVFEAIGLVDEGSKKLIQIPATRLYNEAFKSNPSLSFTQIDSLIDIMSWLTYLATAEYAEFELIYQVVMVTAPDTKLFLIRNEGDGFGMTNPGTNYWQSFFGNQPLSDSTLTSLVFKNVIMKNDSCVELYCLRAQDMFNTAFDTSRTTKIPPAIAASVLPEYEKHWLSWFPNSGLDLTTQTAMYQQVTDFCRQRTSSSWQHLADRWLPNSNFTLADRKKVSLVFDSISGSYASIKLNTLTIDSNWKGLYYPKPALRISVDSLNIPLGTVLKWKEYPDSALSFNLFADSNVTLTPILVANNQTSINSVEQLPNIYLLPNPASSNVRVATGNHLIEDIKLFSLDGREVQQSTTNQFSVQDVAEGYYLCVITTPHGTATRRLIVSR